MNKTNLREQLEEIIKEKFLKEFDQKCKKAIENYLDKTFENSIRLIDVEKGNVEVYGFIQEYKNCPDYNVCILNLKIKEEK